MTQALKLLHTYYTSGLSHDEPTSFPHTQRKQLSRSAKVNLMKSNFPLTSALALSYKLQCWGSCNVMSLFQGRLHIQTKSWGRWLSPTASIFKLQRTPLVQRTWVVSPMHPVLTLPSTESFSIARLSPRLQCGGRQNPRMLLPVLTRELST